MKKTKLGLILLSAPLLAKTTDKKLISDLTGTAFAILLFFVLFGILSDAFGRKEEQLPETNNKLIGIKLILLEIFEKVKKLYILIVLKTSNK